MLRGGPRLGWALRLGSWWFDRWAKSVKGDFVWANIYPVPYEAFEQTKSSNARATSLQVPLVVESSRSK